MSRARPVGVHGGRQSSRAPRTARPTAWSSAPVVPFEQFARRGAGATEAIAGERRAAATGPEHRPKGPRPSKLVAYGKRKLWITGIAASTNDWKPLGEPAAGASSIAMRITWPA